MTLTVQYELEKFDDIYSDAKWLEGKTAKKTNGRTEIESTPGKAGPGTQGQASNGIQEHDADRPVSE